MMIKKILTISAAAIMLPAVLFAEDKAALMKDMAAQEAALWLQSKKLFFIARNQVLLRA